MTKKNDIGKKRERCYQAILKEANKRLERGQYYKENNGVLVIPYLYLRKCILKAIKELDDSTCGKTESQYLKMRLLREEKIFIQNFGYPPRLTIDELYRMRVKKRVLERIDKPYTAEEISELERGG